MTKRIEITLEAQAGQWGELLGSKERRPGVAESGSGTPPCEAVVAVINDQKRPTPLPPQKPAGARRDP